MSEEQEIQIRSEEVQEILGYVPNWMIRWGNTLVFLLIFGFLLASWFIKYPDVIVSQVTITTFVPPEKIYAKQTGQLDAILVSDNEKVTENKILGIVENSSNYQDVILLKSIVDTLKVNYQDFYFPLEKLPVLFLGDIDVDYAIFESKYNEYQLNKELKPFLNELLANQLSLIEAKNRMNTLLSQQSINKSELNLKKKDLNRSKSLYNKGVISAQEYDQKKLDYLQSRRDYKNNSASISQLKDVLNNSAKNLRSSKIQQIQGNNKLLKSTIQSYNKLKKSLKNWELNYVLKSSLKGKVSFLSFWDENQLVKQGDLVFTVIPDNNSYFIGKIKAPRQNSGKIKIGQKVNIRLANYPYQEFGMLEGTIKNISLIVDADGNYLIDVRLPEKLITTYKKEIEFKQEMKGKAEIITEDLRLLERFFYRLRRIFNR